MEILKTIAAIAAALAIVVAAAKFVFLAATSCTRALSGKLNFN
jgi:hypothetical protein